MSMLQKFLPFDSKTPRTKMFPQAVFSKHSYPQQSVVDVILSNELFKRSVLEFSICVVTNNSVETHSDVILFGT